MKRTKRNGVRVRIVETGEVFNSIQACADYLGVNVHWLGQVVRGDRGLCTCHGYHVVAYDEDLYSMRTEYRGRPGVRLKNIETGEIFGSITECARCINGSPGAIHDVLSGRRKAYKGYHFVVVD